MTSSQFTTIHNRTEAARVLLNVALVLIFALLVVARNPNVFILGRFWAEEGRDYFATAWEAGHAWLPGLTFVLGGYIDLAASVPATIAAHWVPLEDAPYLTSAFGLAAQLFPPLILLSSGDQGWRNRPVVLIAALLLILIPPLKQEVWLNTIASQYHFALGCALALALPPGGRISAALRGFVLVIGPLAGPACVILAPLFGVRALRDKDRWRWREFALIGAASLIQLTVMALHREPRRDFATGPVILSYTMLDQFLVLPFFGISFARNVSSALLDAWEAGRVFWPAVFVAPICSVVLVAATLRGRRDNAAFWFAITGLWLALVSFLGALTIGRPQDLILVVFGTRYAYTPQVLISLALLRIGTTASRNMRWLPLLLAGWLIVVGAIEYRHPDGAATSGPSWASQVALWRHDPSTTMQLWPAWFRINLTPRE
jgi:hypothetical protein